MLLHQQDHRTNYIHRKPVNTRNGQLMNLSVPSWQSILLGKTSHQSESICSLLNWLSSRLLYDFKFVDLLRQVDHQGHSYGHHPESVQESPYYQTHQYYFLCHIDNATEKAYCDAKLTLVHFLILQGLANHPVFALLPHKDPFPNDLLFYVSPGNPFSSPEPSHLVPIWHFLQIYHNIF